MEVVISWSLAPLAFSHAPSRTIGSCVTSWSSTQFTFTQWSNRKTTCSPAPPHRALPPSSSSLSSEISSCWKEKGKSESNRPAFTGCHLILGVFLVRMEGEQKWDRTDLLLYLQNLGLEKIFLSYFLSHLFLVCLIGIQCKSNRYNSSKFIFYTVESLFSIS